MGTTPEEIGGGSGGQKHWLSRRWSIGIGVVVVAALVAGGVYLARRDTKPSSEAAAWASSVCTSVSTWESQTKAIATDMSATPSKATANEKITQIEAATTTMLNDIKASPLPSTSNSESAKAQLDALVQDAKTTATNIQKQAETLTGNGAAGFAAGVATIAAETTALVDQAQTTIKNLKGLGSDLGKAISQDKTCQSLA